jgi:hypothetical protein
MIASSFSSFASPIIDFCIRICIICVYRIYRYISYINYIQLSYLALLDDGFLLLLLASPTIHSLSICLSVYHLSIYLYTYVYRLECKIDFI